MKVIAILALSVFTLGITSCGNNPDNVGHSTPIDSSNVKGSPAATYGANNPASDETDSNRTNVNDTGTKANNVHNAGTYNNSK